MKCFNYFSTPNPTELITPPPHQPRLIRGHSSRYFILHYEKFKNNIDNM